MNSDQCAYCGDRIEQPASGRRRKWCEDKCRKAASSPPPREGEAAVPIGPAVEELLELLEFAPDDPRRVHGMMLRRAAAAADADGGFNVGVARELRQLLTAISYGGGAPGEVDTRRVEFLRARVMSGLGL